MAWKSPSRVTVLSLLALLGSVALALWWNQSDCVSLDHDNILADKYRHNITGVLNSTIVAVPIPLSEARQLIPPQWRILETAYRSMIPDFPPDMYPLIIQGVHDHDVQLSAYWVKLADFSVCHKTSRRPHRGL